MRSACPVISTRSAHSGISITLRGVMHPLHNTTETAKSSALMSMNTGVADGPDFIDLHVDSFITVRALGYDIGRTHPLRFGGRFFGHLDLPRAKEGGLSGGLWSITTNPLRRKRSRLETLRTNVAHLRRVVEGLPSQARIVTNASEYDACKAAGLHAVMPVVQGANCLGPETSFRAALHGADVIVSATLVPLVSTEH